MRIKRMKVIHSPRASGKSTQAIKASSETGATIVTRTEIMADLLNKQASELGYSIPRPISIYQYHDMKVKPENIIIDELESVLRCLIPSKIELVTITKEVE